MVVDKEFLKNISNQREKRLMMLSYRRYRRLGRLQGGIGQEIFDKYKSEYTPKIWAYALSIYVHSDINKPFSKHYFKVALKYEKYWDKLWSDLPYIHISLNDDQLEKQFEFMGYVKDLKTHDLYAYVSSNRQIKGHWWIHPKKYTDNITSIEKRPSVPYIYDNWDPDVLEGYTKILRHGS